MSGKGTKSKALMFWDENSDEDDEMTNRIGISPSNSHHSSHHLNQNNGHNNGLNNSQTSSNNNSRNSGNSRHNNSHGIGSNVTRNDIVNIVKEDDNSDDDDDGDLGPTPLSTADSFVPDYFTLYQDERRKRVAAEEKIVVLELRIKNMSKELAVYKGVGFAGDDVDDVGEDDNDGLIGEETRQMTGSRTTSTTTSTTGGTSTEWQILAEQEKERRMKARIRNARGGNAKRSMSAGVKTKHVEEVNIPSVASAASVSNEVSQLANSVQTTAAIGSSTVEPVQPKKAAISTVLDWDSTDDDDVGANASLTAQTIEPDSTANVASTSQNSAAQPTSEWERLAQEEKDRKLRARQRQLQQSAGRGRTGRSANAAARRLPSKGSSISVQVDVTQKLQAQIQTVNSEQTPSDASQTGQHSHASSFPARRRSRGMSMESGSGWSDSGEDGQEQSARQRDDSFFDSDGDSDAEDEGKDPISTNPVPNNIHNSFGIAVSVPVTPAIDALEAAVDAEVLAWAVGKSIAHLIQTCGLIFPAIVPNLGPAWDRHLIPPQDPQSIRRAFLLTVRCCHPDKQPSNAPERQQMLAAKVFATLSDAYAAFKTYHNL